MTSPSQAAPTESGLGSVFASVRNGFAAVAKYAEESGLNDRVAPIVGQGKEVTSTGVTWVNQAVTSANDAVTNKDAFEHQRRLNDLFVEVMSAQQGLIEDLRARVATLEGRS